MIFIISLSIASIKVLTKCIKFMISTDYAVRVKHWYQNENFVLKNLRNLRISVVSQELQESFHSN